MRLMRPSPGEAHDRMTILVLKIAHSGRKEFQEEHDALVEYLSDNKLPQAPSELVDELGKINARLWDLEDAQRKLMDDIHFHSHSADDPITYFTENAITIVQLNDARAETVKKINKACGIESVEKLYHG